jgi:hypothetical protein
LVDGGVSILQYADDTIIFLEHDLEKTLNMKLVSYIFEQLSSLSEIYCFGHAKHVENAYKQLFGCELGTLPFKYLGIPIHFRKLKMESGNQ